MAKDPTEIITKYLQKKKAVREHGTESSPAAVATPKDHPIEDAAEPSQKRRKERKKKNSVGTTGDADAKPELTRKKSSKTSLPAGEDAPKVALETSSASIPASAAQDDSGKPKRKLRKSKSSQAIDAALEEPLKPVSVADASPSKSGKKSKKAAVEQPVDEAEVDAAEEEDAPPKKKSKKTVNDAPAKKTKGRQGKKESTAAGISKQWLAEDSKANEEDGDDEDAEANPAPSKRKAKTASAGKQAAESKVKPMSATQDAAPKEKGAASKAKALKSTTLSKKDKAAANPSKKLKSSAPPADDLSEPESEHADENDESEENASGEVEEEVFLGFQTDDDDDDSSDDEDMDFDPDGMDVSKLPTIAKDDATVKRKLEKAKKQPSEDRGVIYLGRIPHGFYETQMKSYFSQFGNVTRLRLSRNKKTGRSKHYGFIEFDSASVAQIVAETMDNYLLTGHILTCKVIPKDKVHPELWVGANRKWRVVPRDRVARVQHNKPRTEDEQEQAEKRLLKRQAQKKRKLEEAGIKYDFDAVAYKKRPKSVKA